MIRINSNLRQINLGDNEMISSLIQESLSKLEAGFFDAAKYPDGKHVAQVAIENEFGTMSIPSRPFFRNAVANNRVKWVDDFRALVIKSRDAKKSLEVLGQIVRGAVIQSINEIQSPPNSPTTIKAKGSSKPLVDTGTLRRSVSYRVIS